MGAPQRWVYIDHLANQKLQEVMNMVAVRGYRLTRTLTGGLMVMIGNHDSKTRNDNALLSLQAYLRRFPVDLQQPGRYYSHGSTVKLVFVSMY